MSRPAHVDEFVQTYTPIAEQISAETGIPFLVIMGQAAIETGWGRSTLAKDYNNLFGIKLNSSELANAKAQERGVTVANPVNFVKRKDDDKGLSYFKVYDSPLESFRAHSELITKPNGRYAPLFNLSPADYSTWFYKLRSLGYSTNKNYGENCTKTVHNLIIPSLQEQFPEKADILIRGEVSPEVRAAVAASNRESEVAEAIENLEVDPVVEEETVATDLTADKELAEEVDETEDEEESEEMTPGNMLMKLMSSGGFGGGGQGQDIFSGLFSMLMMLFMMAFADGKTKKEATDEAQDVIRNKSLDVSRFNPNAEKTILSLSNDGRFTLTTIDKGQTKTMAMSEADSTKLNEVIASSANDEEKQQYFAQIIDKYNSAPSYNIAASQNFEQEMSMHTEAPEITRGV